MATNSINPGVVDKAQVFAGVRKLSDAATGMVAELSADWNSNNGSFFAAAPGNPTTNRYSSGSRGNASVDTGQVGNVTAAGSAPDTAVFTAQHDISADLSTVNRNGVAGTNGTADKGSGNFGNYPLFICARNQTSLYFNGWIYSLIVRFGSNLTSQQIASTESWVASKSGVQL
jgi:hypothetical protein